MGFMGGGGGDSGAAQARADELARQSRIKEGTLKISDIFSQFNDEYYGGLSKKYLSFYNPQLQEQFDKESRATTLALSRTGNLSSSAGARKINELAKLFKRQEAFVGSSARDFEKKARGDVENARNDLLAQLNASADPEAAGLSATTRAGILSRPASFSPLQNVFTGFADQISTGILAERMGFPGLKTGLFDLPASGGSSRVIR